MRQLLRCGPGERRKGLGRLGLLGSPHRLQGSDFVGPDPHRGPDHGPVAHGPIIFSEAGTFFVFAVNNAVPQPQSSGSFRLQLISSHPSSRLPRTYQESLE